MKAALILSLSVLLAGCAVSREVHLANGWLAFEINCGGPLSSHGQCLDKAGDVCPRGYEVLLAEGVVVPDQPTQVPASGATQVSLKSESRRLLVRCR